MAKPIFEPDYFGTDEAGICASLIADWACIHQGSYKSLYDIALMLGLTDYQIEIALFRLKRDLGTELVADEKNLIRH